MNEDTQIAGVIINEADDSEVAGIIVQGADGDEITVGFADIQPCV